MTSSAIHAVRTPDENFVGLADFPFEPNYFDLDGLRMHYLDEGPADGPVALMVHGSEFFTKILVRFIENSLIKHC